jgi:hypothetical protein
MWKFYTFKMKEEEDVKKHIIEFNPSSMAHRYPLHKSHLLKPLHVRMGVVVVDRSAVESPPAKSQPTQEYLGFTQFVEEPTCTEKVHLASGDGITKSDGMEPNPPKV